MSAVCCHCGGLQDAGTPIWRGNWLISPYEIYHDTKQVRLSRAVSRTLYAIGRANGQPLTHRDLPNATAQTLANHVREIRKATGEDFPLHAFGNRGWAWRSQA